MTRTFIYGSCVSRDTFEFLRPHGYDLVRYVARQSLVSAFSPGLEAATLPGLDVTSPFQRRMLAGDWGSSLVPQLRAHREEVDLLLWDLCDERLGVWRLPEGEVVTRSVDAISSGLEASLADRAEVVSFGSPGHLAAFTDASRQFRDVLADTGLLERTLLLAPPWATHTDDGSPTPTSFGLSAQVANGIFDAYHRVVQNILDVPVVTLGQDRVVAAAGHQWGPAPFHYADSVYEALVTQVLTEVPVP